jgi:hypothetical protein
MAAMGTHPTTDNHFTTHLISALSALSAFSLSALSAL